MRYYLFFNPNKNKSVFHDWRWNSKVVNEFINCDSAVLFVTFRAVFPLIIRKRIHAVPRRIYQNGLHILSVLFKLLALNFVFSRELNHFEQIFWNLIFLSNYVLLPRHNQIKNANSIWDISFVVHFFWGHFLFLDACDCFGLLFLWAFAFTFLRFGVGIIFFTTVGRFIFVPSVAEVIIYLLNRLSFPQTNVFS